MAAPIIFKGLTYLGGLLVARGVYNYFTGEVNVSDKEIAKGSNGTVIFEGSYGPPPARKAAVKRVVGVYSNVGREEYNMYMEADGINNIVRCYGMESDWRYVYLFLEPCICSLKDLIQIYSPYALPIFQSESEITRLISVKNVLGNRVNLWKENDYPSPLLLKLMRDVVCGLMKLHENKIAHLNVASQNILIAGNTPNLCAKLSDMAKSKKFRGENSSSSHYATYSEQPQFNSEASKDLFLFGHILSFCIHGGRYPFSDPPERYIANCSPPEAVDLISQLISRYANMRPKAIDVYHHPLFWNSDKKLSFLRDTSDLTEGNKKGQLYKELNKLQGEVIGSSWDTKIDSKLISAIEDRGVRFYRQYNYNNFLDLLRLVRNYFHHYLELPNDIQELLGSKPEGYYEYFETRFPKLVIEVYKVVRKFCQKKGGFQKYFHSYLAE
ncbi:hypothetical protein UlMin_002934 [Ulmus minor]